MPPQLDRDHTLCSCPDAVARQHRQHTPGFVQQALALCVLHQHHTLFKDDAPHLWGLRPGESVIGDPRWGADKRQPDLDAIAFLRARETAMASSMIENN